MPSPPRLAVVLVGLALALGVALFSLAIGVIHVPLADLLAALGDLIAPARGAASTSSTVVLQMRLPRTLGALCTGAALGTAGCMLQALLRNPLASPAVIGTSQAAAFGKVLAVFVGLPYAAAVSLSFAMALCGAALVVLLARTRVGLQADSVVLTGVNVSLMFAALVGLLECQSRDEGQLSRMVMILLGGLWQVTWQPLGFIAPAVLLAVIAAHLHSRPLDLLALGESDAERLGLRVHRAGGLVLIHACLLTSLAVCLAGVVAFVGLVVPHAARRLVGPAHAALLPASALLGGLFVVATDTVARTAASPNEIPLGVVTSLIGVPCFLLVMRSMRLRRGEA